MRALRLSAVSADTGEIMIIDIRRPPQRPETIMEEIRQCERAVLHGASRNFRADYTCGQYGLPCILYSQAYCEKSRRYGVSGDK